MVVDAAGNAYIAGSTSSSDFPATLGSSASASSGKPLPFVMKLNPAGDVVFCNIFESDASAGAISLASGPLLPWPGVIAGVYQLTVSLPETIQGPTQLPLYVTINGLPAGPFGIPAGAYQMPGTVCVGQ